jgi:hypothetical protein
VLESACHSVDFVRRGISSTPKHITVFTYRLVGHAGWDVIREARLSAIPPRIAAGLQDVDKGQARV